MRCPQPVIGGYQRPNGDWNGGLRQVTEGWKRPSSDFDRPTAAYGWSEEGSGGRQLPDSDLYPCNRRTYFSSVTDPRPNCSGWSCILTILYPHGLVSLLFHQGGTLLTLTCGPLQPSQR